MSDNLGHLERTGKDWMESDPHGFDFDNPLGRLAIHRQIKEDPWKAQFDDPEWDDARTIELRQAINLMPFSASWLRRLECAFTWGKRQDKFRQWTHWAMGRCLRARNNQEKQVHYWSANGQPD